MLAKITISARSCYRNLQKKEAQIGFAHQVEKAETGAIGRILAMCRYGILQAPEFDEQDRLANAPGRFTIHRTYASPIAPRTFLDEDPSGGCPKLKDNEMKSNSLEQIISKMYEYIRKDVATGFSIADEICDSVVEIFSDEQDSSVLLPYAKRMVQENIESQMREQVNWQETTDCNRLDQAFENLSRQGIISRQNYSCCGNCGTGEIWEEMLAIQTEGMYADTRFIICKILNMLLMEKVYI